MATFPTLTPSSRSFTPGLHPHSTIPTMNGLQTRVRTSNVLLEQRLRLTFVGLTEAQMLSIRTHYNTQQGRFLSFDIPTSLLSGMTTPASFTPTGYSWLYASTPQVEDIGCQRYTVSLELVTVPPEGANISGAEFTVPITFAAGVATGSADIAGFTLTIAASLESGAGTSTDGVTTGFDLTIAASLESGAAITEDANATGFDLTVTASLTSGAPSETDPDFSSVSLLLHMDGSNNSTTFTDSSSNTLTVTANGNAKISTAQSKFGGSSGLLDGTGDYLSVNNSAVALATSDHTVETWIRLIALPTTRWGISYNGDTTSNNNRIQFEITPTGAVNLFLQAGTGTGVSFTSTATLSTGTWYHVAYAKSGNDVYVFIDGVLEASGTYSTSISTNNNFYAGLTRNSGATWSLDGYLDDFRVTKGVARYTAAFTAPLAAFPNS